MDNPFKGGELKAYKNNKKNCLPVNIPVNDSNINLEKDHFTTMKTNKGKKQNIYSSFLEFA